MTSPKRLAWLVPVLLVGCYDPNIEDGSLSCSLAGKECPDGFRCNSSGLCARDGAGGKGGAGGAGGAGGMGGAGGTPGTGCTLPPGGVPVCSSPACTSGQMCLDEVCTECGKNCYRTCSTDDQCGPDGRCTIVKNEEIAGKIVQTPFACFRIEPCNPALRVANTCGRPDRPPGRWGCYIMTARYADLPVCDCAGSKKLGQLCGNEHDCEPGLECVAWSSELRCRPICRLGLVNNCPAGTVCEPFKGAPPGNLPSTKFGYCRPL